MTAVTLIAPRLAVYEQKTAWGLAEQTRVVSAPSPVRAVAENDAAKCRHRRRKQPLRTRPVLPQQMIGQQKLGERGRIAGAEFAPILISTELVYRNGLDTARELPPLILLHFLGRIRGWLSGCCALGRNWLCVPCSISVVRGAFSALEHRRDIFHRGRAPFLIMLGKI